MSNQTLLTVTLNRGECIKYAGKIFQYGTDSATFQVPAADFALVEPYVSVIDEEDDTEEMYDFTLLPGVGAATQKKLYEAEIFSIESLLATDNDTLADITGITTERWDDIRANIPTD
jgi:hypothetical protein